MNDYSGFEDFLEHAVPELLHFVLDHCGENLSFLAYFYKLCYLQLDLSISNLSKTLVSFAKAMSCMNDPELLLREMDSHRKNSVKKTKRDNDEMEGDSQGQQDEEEEDEDDEDDMFWR